MIKCANGFDRGVGFQFAISSFAIEDRQSCVSGSHQGRPVFGGKINRQSNVNVTVFDHHVAFAKDRPINLNPRGEALTASLFFFSGEPNHEQNIHRF